ncbi:hypothetical protein F5J12DRAFT_893087 [Pisolithus orientalis]|uniref:uncharacterized protein n=1 Tax=Pisolithus orientalis TaxID=936130 RepID=UPI0022240702|nr:uncharacterized protein F5J12DRAFT_893087 [Pisolithus orientalis]KAI6006350.1 hypothetical protein F5J12DRAFT_893087 [Pisolithus orientalis]
MSEDFTLDIDAVGHDSLDENTDNDEDVLHAANHGAARGAGTNLDWELNEVRRVMATPAPDVSPAELRQALGQLIAQGPLDAAIITLAKKYAYFYHLWVPSGIFPLHACPPDFDLHDLIHYQTPESKAIANGAELYLMVPPELQGSDYEFTSMVNGKCGNILKPVKDSVMQLFAHLSPGLDPGGTLNHDEAYTPLALILFEDPSAMNVSGLFKNKALTQARFLLSGDDEFSSTGSQTGISYEKDFKFYIELLRKQENKNDGSQQPPPKAEDSVEVLRSWEDDILAQLGGVGGTAEVNSNPPTVPITSQSATHPSILTSTIQAEDFPPPQIRAIQPNTNLSISVLEARTVSPSQSVIVSATSSELSLPLSTLSLGGSQPSVSTHLNPLDPLVVVPALVSGRSSKATKKGKKATQGQAKAMEEGIGAVPARVTHVTRQKK